MKVRLRYLFRLHLCCLFHTFFPLLKKRRLNNTVIQQQNNVTPHKVNIVKVFMIDNATQVLSLAALSPGINCIEKSLGQHIDRTLRNKLPSGVLTLFLVGEMQMKPSTGRQSYGARIILGGPGKFQENGLKIVHFRAIFAIKMYFFL